MVKTSSKAFKAFEELTYFDWMHAHSLKHTQVIEKLFNKGYIKNQIVNYFDYDNLSKKEPNFCPLFKQNKKCHEIEKLNCFFCGCPHFRFYENPKDNKYSFCAINSSYGVQKCYKNQYHQDCSNCYTPHKSKYVLQNYTHNWYELMKACRIET